MPESLRDGFGLISPEELAQLLELQPETLSNWRANYKGPPYLHIGRKVYYRRSDVDAWLVSITVRPKSSSADERDEEHG
jgi:predicted DNA-binding transcriptional regulator AlpA